MSKFNEHFDNIKATDEMKEKVAARIAAPSLVTAGKKTRPSQRRWAIPTALLTASILIFAIFIPIFSSAIFSGDSPNFNQARQVQNTAHLQQLLNVQEGGSSFNFPLGCSSLLLGCSSGDYWGSGGDNNVNQGAPDRDTASPPPGSGGTSETNVQIVGMDEGDIVRNDGNFIYRLSPNGLTIVETDRGFITPVASIAYHNFSPIEMFVRGDLMVIIGGAFYNPQTSWNEDVIGGWMDFRSWHSRVQIRIYDITARENPVLMQFYEIDGRFETSRIRQECETLFFVVNYFPHRWCRDWRETEVRRPYFRMSDDEEFSPFPYENMFYFRRNPTQSYMILGRISLTDFTVEPMVRAYLSSANIISVGLNNLYTSTTRRSRNISGNITNHRSYITRFCLETLDFTGYVTVQGSPPSRHAIDEYRGYLRVATTYGEFNWRTNTLASAIFVFNSELREVSRITGIAPREQMDSVAFDGNFGFISTSPPDLIWDPLYTIDLTDPHNPILSEGLETDGINDYLRPIRGTPFVIGIGQDAPPQGSALQTGIKIELYYMRPGTGLMPESMAKFTIYGNAAFAEVLRNPRALLFMFDEETKQGIVGFAAESAHWGWSGGMSSFSGTLSQGFFLFTFDAYLGTMEFVGETEQRLIYGYNSTVVLAPTFSNFDITVPIFDWNANWSSSRWQDQINALNYYISRAIVNQGYLYTISDNIIAGYCLRTMARIDEFRGN
ncbi:MAG: beta-propeller domain-containing protein [Firmicutes bacterium]|nr:beta-propeller domain-containing protein [Bacillota bacterium]